MFKCRLGFIALICFALNFSVYGRDEIGTSKKLFKIANIMIKGAKKVEPEAILEKISLKKGDWLTNVKLQKAIKRIYALNYFAEVEAHQEKKNLILKVKEKPIISKIWIKGNDEISDDDLSELLKTQEHSILDVNSIHKDLKELLKHYEEKGFYLANINYSLEKKNSDHVELTFNVQEYEKVRVKQILILGNQFFSDQELKGIMETREEGLFSGMSGAGSFKEFNFQTDLERIKYFYKTKGHLQANVGTPEVTVSEDKKWVFITVKINEGPQFTVNDVTFQGEVLFDDDELLEKVRLKSGNTYSEEMLRKDIQLLTEMYQDKGYAFANVLRTLRIVPGENKVDLEFSFEKGKIAYFGKIVVKGNSKTRDKVIRREIRIREGAQFSGTKLRISKDNVNRLGFFEPGSVIFNTITPAGRDDVLDVEIQVKERNTGQISLGAGYSSATGAFIQASIAQNNFRGLGQNLSFSFSYSKTQNTFNLGFTEPYLFDSKWTAGFDLFRKISESSSAYKYRQEGFALRVGYPIFDYTRLYLSYKFENTELTDINDPLIDSALENGIASIVETTLVRDKRNNKFEPSRGYYMSASAEFAGVGGEKKWSKLELDGRYYKRVYGDLVFRSHIFTGMMSKVNGQAIPRTQKFALGGPRNLRGYRIEGVGPMVLDKDAEGRDTWFNSRGLFSLFTTLEFEHPLAREAGLKWVVFFDAGNVYSKFIGEGGAYDLKSDYGFGFRWFSPIGVLRFEFGYPINPTDRDENMQFHFDIGQLF